MSLMRFLVLTGLTWAVLSDHSVAVAQRPKYGLSPEDQRRHDELMESARRSQSAGTLAMQAGAALMSLATLYGAYSTARKGFKITEQRRLEGRPAYVLAGLLVLLAIAIGIAGIVYLPSLMP